MSSAGSNVMTLTVVITPSNLPLYFGLIISFMHLYFTRFGDSISIVVTNDAAAMEVERVNTSDLINY